MTHNNNPHKPTVLAATDFDVAVDGEALRAAMRGLGTDEQAIIDILSTRSNGQRQQIAQYFTNTLGRDVFEDLKSELGGAFEEVIVALMIPTEQYLCKELHNAMDGAGTDESTLVEILCTKNNEEVQQLVREYEDMFDRPLAEHLCSETDGYFRRLLTLIITGVRDQSGAPVDADAAREQAAALYAAGESKLGTDEEVFNRIFAHSSFAQLRRIFEEYKELSGQTIEQAIQHEMDDDLKDAILAIVECVQSPAAFFAQRLNGAMDGMGTSDSTLIRIVVSRSEIDLGNIKDEYERIYNRTLLSAVKNEISGEYNSALCALIGDA